MLCNLLSHSKFKFCFLELSGFLFFISGWLNPQTQNRRIWWADCSLKAFTCLNHETSVQNTAIGLALSLGFFTAIDQNVSVEGRAATAQQCLEKCMNYCTEGWMDKQNVLRHGQKETTVLLVPWQLILKAIIPQETVPMYVFLSFWPLHTACGIFVP